MSLNRNCVFCGKETDNSSKSKEHVFPQWLIKLTGDPKRTVYFGFNYCKRKFIRYDWSSFTIKACNSCNSEYAKLEEKIKNYVKRLLAKQALNSIEYIEFLDWLDKIRIALWITYNIIQKDPMKIIPNFYVDQRIAKKDRMLAIYPINSSKLGLNAFGVETLCFQLNPCCFSLRINGLIILNMSSDFLFSHRCGFPYPEKKK